MGSNSVEINRLFFRAVGGLMLTDTPGGRDELRELVDPALRDIVDELDPGRGRDAVLHHEGVLDRRHGGHPGHRLPRPRRQRPARRHCADHQARRRHGDARRDDLHRRPRARRANGPGRKAGRRPAAILFADLEASSPLARRLSTASYFALGRRLVRAADQCVVDAGGLVGRHVGDGVGAFFLAETAGSESAAAQSCIAAARALREAVAEVAERSELQPEDVVLRFGLHWGANLYVGNISTAGRSEVNALGDQVNEAARIEACASGGLALASKDLIERLEPDAAAALGLEPDRITYTALGDLTTATEKARRDAPAIAVCEI